MSIDKNKIALETAFEQERELKQELKFIQAYIKRLQLKVGDRVGAIESAEEKEAVEEQTAPTINADIPKGYNNSLSLVKKFISLLKHHNRFLHFREVAEMMIEIDPSLGDAKSLAAKISASTTKLKGKHIFKYQVDSDNRQTYWGIKDWMKPDGSIKEEHMYKDGYGRPGATTESLFDF